MKGAEMLGIFLIRVHSPIIIFIFEFFFWIDAFPLEYLMKHINLDILRTPRCWVWYRLRWTLDLRKDTYLYTHIYTIESHEHWYESCSTSNTVPCCLCSPILSADMKIIFVIGDSHKRWLINVLLTHSCNRGSVFQIRTSRYWDRFLLECVAIYIFD